VDDKCLAERQCNARRVTRGRQHHVLYNADPQVEDGDRRGDIANAETGIKERIDDPLSISFRHGKRADSSQTTYQG
jgi:hypothetical protein